MVTRSQFRFVTALLVSTGLASTAAVPIAAESAPYTAAAATQAGSAPSATSPLAQFAPQTERREHRIDYQHWDEALAWMVVPMGPSIRHGSSRVQPGTGTRRIYGHESRLRLEGNRVAFSFLTPQMKLSLSEYRADLERVGTQLDITSLPRNEQLAYWLNLHNVAMIEAVADRYPLTELDEEKSVDDIKLVTVNGVALSPRDIREGIVYPNWRDPKVIYGFWRGIIGGPSIQRLAFSGGNVDALLALSAEEFVNSLRGVERWGGSLRVSPIYEEAQGFYFADDEALRSHLSQYGRQDVRDLVSRTPQVAFKGFENDIADLARGELEPIYSNIAVVDCNGTCTKDMINQGNALPQRTRYNPAIVRLMEERAQKLEIARREGIRTGMVIYGDGDYAPGETPPEVE